MAYNPTTPLRRQPRRCVRLKAWLGWLTASVFFSILAAPVDAFAKVPGLTLTWSAPSGCPDSVEVEQSIEKLLGERAPGKAFQPIRVRVEVQSLGPGHFRAEVAVSGSAAGSRHLAGASCQAMALASAVVIALAMAPDAVPQPPTEPPKRLLRFPPPQSRIVAFALAWGGGIFGSLPHPALDLGLGIGARRGHWETLLLFGYAPPQTFRLGVGNPGARLDRSSATGLGCFAVIAESPSIFEGCLGAELERLAARALSVSNPGRGAAVLVSPVATIKSETRLFSKVSLVLAVSALVRPFHPRFVINHSRLVYAIPSVSGSLIGGLQLAF